MQALQEKEEPSVFEEIVEEDAGVCDNCFKRTHQVEENWHPSQSDLLKKGHDGKYYEISSVEREKKFSHQRFHPIRENVEKTYVAQRKDASGSVRGRNICKQCGIVDRGTKFRPISKKEAIQFTQRLADRLDESEYDYDKDVLFKCVRHLKSRPDHQNADDDIFQAAVKIAIDYADKNHAEA